MSEPPKPAYAIAILRDVTFGTEIIQYMREIDRTLTPFGGEFLVHGGRTDAVEGNWDGDIVILRFPSHTDAQCWYDSADYRRILPLRLQNSTSQVALVEGVEPGHTGAEKVKQLLSRDASS